MSVTVAKADGVIVLTLTDDPQSPCPPLCQILKGLCYNPVCFSVSQHLRRVQGTSQSGLGALHIMVGLLNIGLGLILYFSRGGFALGMDRVGFPFWLGGLFMLFGIMSILSEKRPSPCLVILNVTLNLTGVGVAITAIVLSSINLGDMWWGGWGWWTRWCDDYYYSSQYYTPTPSSPARENIMREKCLEGKALTMMLLRSINALLIVLSVLELCVTISSAVMGIKALRSSEKRDNKGINDPECCKTLEEVISNHTT